MKQKKLSALSVDDLVKLFAAIAVEQDNAILENASSKYNRLYKQMSEVVSELKVREGDGRHSLTVLYDYPNMQVRLKAAIHTLFVAPVESRQLLEAIKAAAWYPQTADAYGMLDAVKEGRYVPE